MKKIRVTKKDALAYYRLELLSDIQTLRKAMESFKNKYSLDFPDFEKKILKQNKEDFEAWDDYLEWKSFWQSYQEKLTEMKELENEQDIEVITE